MRTVHDLKDLAMIYHDDDDYKIKVWDPIQQKEYVLTFTGSSSDKKELNFNISQVHMDEKDEKRIELLNKAIALYRYKNIIEKEIEEINKEW